MIRNITQREESAPAKIPVDLNIGRITLREVLGVGATAIGALAVANVGGVLAHLAVPAEGDGALVWLWLFGVSTAVLGYYIAVVTVRLFHRAWASYQARVDSWHDAALETYLQNGGVATTRVTSLTELSATNPRDVLLTAIAVHVRHQAGDKSAYTVRSLRGQVWLAHTRIGDVVNAEEMARSLAAVGLIADRSGRRSGAWVPETLEELLSIYEANKAKIGNAAPMLPLP